MRMLDQMSMNFEELDSTTRSWMLRRFDAEEASGAPYRSKVLSSAGLALYPELVRSAIQDPSGTERSLAQALNYREFWNTMDSYVRKGVWGERRVNIGQASERLALTEFNTWYVAGLAHRLVDEGEGDCKVYRACEPKFEHASCSAHEGKTYALASIIDGHRVGYWPEPGNPNVISIPAGPGCHHTISRI